MKLPSRLASRAYDYLWPGDTGVLQGWRRRIVLTLRTIYALARDLAEGQLTLRAMSLVYTTLLSLVPLIALSFSVLKGFGVHNQIRPLLLAFLEPLGEKGVEITDEVIGFVSNVRVGVLGALGLGLLIYTVITLLQKIELSFNFVWRVKRQRRLAQRFSHYLSVLLIGPVLVFSAVGVTAAFFGSSLVQTLVAVDFIGRVVEFAATLLPFLLVIAAFTFIYILMPNTRVRFGSALVGATVAGVLWQTLGWGFAAFIAASNKYTAIYAGFAIVIFSMIWLYLNWLIVLIGASLAFYHQNPSQLASPRRETVLSNRVKEKLALLAMNGIGRNYYTGVAPWTLDALAEHLDVTPMALESVMIVALQAGFITETADDPPRFVPARAFESITVKELLDAVRRAGEEPGVGADNLPREPDIDALFARLDHAADDSLHERRLSDLAQNDITVVAERAGVRQAG